MIQAIQSTLSMVLIISIGYFLTWKKRFTEEISDVFVKLVTVVSLPFLMINNVVNNFNRDELLSSLSGLIVPFASMFICHIVGIFIAKFGKVKEGHSGIFKSMFANSNTIFMGLPVNISLFGEKSVPYALLYYVANTTFFWTIGIYEISQDGFQKKDKLFNTQALKKILSPPFLGFIIGVILVILNLKLPLFLKDAFKYLGNLSTPMIMIFLGITIYNIGIKNVKFSKDMFLIFIGRFIISPVLVILLSLIFPMPKLMRNVFVIQSVMPVMTNSAIIAKSYGADHEYAAVMIAATTIATLFVVPFYSTILQ